MPFCCSESCCGLITAALFISISVVQLISGLVLLRSSHASILSWPDFWTAATNISVGCLLGVTANVWKNEFNQKFIVIAARYKLVISLLATSIAVNLTTCVILILSEGHTLLLIAFEQNEDNFTPTLTSELLGYAYAASVISPAFCIAVSIASLMTKCPLPKEKMFSKTFKSEILGRSSLSHHIYTLSDSISGNPDKQQSILFPENEFESGLSSETFTVCNSPSCTEYQTQNTSRFSTKDEDNNCDDSLWDEIDICSLDQSVRSSQMAGEVVPVQVGDVIPKTPRFLGIPVPSPVPPEHWKGNETGTFIKSPVLSTFTPRIESAKKINAKAPVTNCNCEDHPTPSTSLNGGSPNQDLQEHYCRKSRVKLSRGEKKKLRSLDTIEENTFQIHCADTSCTSCANTSGYASSLDTSKTACQFTSPPGRQSSDSDFVQVQKTSTSNRSLFRENMSAVSGGNEWI